MTNNKPLNVLASEFPELYNWVKSISRYGKVEDFVIADYKQWKKGETTVSLKFYTKNYQYRISAVRPREEYKGYLECTVLTRKPRAGEDWQRGNDLSDGRYCEETWQAIIRDIIAYELVKVIKPK